MDNKLWKGENIYINELKFLSIYWKKLEYYSIRDTFILAERLYLVNHNKIGSW